MKKQLLIDEHVAQPQLRTLFLTRSALRKYCVQVTGFELPKPAAMAQQEFDHHLATTWDGMPGEWRGNHRREAIISEVPSSLWIRQFGATIRKSRAKWRLSAEHFCCCPAESKV